MNDGKFVYYTMQHRRTHESPWLKPKGKLMPVTDDKEWSFSSWDVFGGTAEPWHGKGNDFRPKYKDAHDETHEVWANTSHHGWWSLAYAVKGLRRLQKAQAKGKFDSRDGYGHHNQALRYEFRLVKMTKSQTTEEVSTEDLMEALEAA
jgi:hypothetical protein